MTTIINKTRHKYKSMMVSLKKRTNKINRVLLNSSLITHLEIELHLQFKCY